MFMIIKESLEEEANVNQAPGGDLYMNTKDFFSVCKTLNHNKL